MSSPVTKHWVDPISVMTALGTIGVKNEVGGKLTLDTKNHTVSISEAAVLQSVSRTLASLTPGGTTIASSEIILHIIPPLFYAHRCMRHIPAEGSADAPAATGTKPKKKKASGKTPASAETAKPAEGKASLAESRGVIQSRIQALQALYDSAIEGLRVLKKTYKEGSPTSTLIQTSCINLLTYQKEGERANPEDYDVPHYNEHGLAELSFTYWSEAGNNELIEINKIFSRAQQDMGRGAVDEVEMNLGRALKKANRVGEMLNKQSEALRSGQGLDVEEVVEGFTHLSLESRGGGGGGGFTE